MQLEDINFFDHRDEFSNTQRRLPHWAQAGTICFITWRAADTLPAKVLHQLDAEIATLLKDECVPVGDDLKIALRQRDSASRNHFQWKLFAARDKYLDAGYGRCLLARAAYANQVLDSLRHFDEDRYYLTDVVVMPNHVHLLAAFASAERMLAQCEGWKRFIGRKINAAENQRGEFWQVDQFDHLVRTQEEFERYREYIKNNPIAAGLTEGFLHYQKAL